MLKFSFIIPHKNCPLFLKRCLASIPVRDDVEVIVVDDASDEALVPRVERADVQLIRTTEGRGAGFARNVGMSRARGRWLVFADADDFFTPALVDAMDRWADDEQTDIVFFDALYLDSLTMEPLRRRFNRRNFIEKYLRTGNEDFLRYRMNAPWGKFIRRRMVADNDLKFNEIRVQNDLWFSMTAGHAASRIEYDPAAVYSYLRHSASLTSTSNDVESVQIKLRDDLAALRFLNSVGRGGLFRGEIKKYWRKVMRLDRAIGWSYLPLIREVVPAGRLRWWMVEMWLGI